MNAYIHTYIQTNKQTYIPYTHTIHTYHTHIHTYITLHYTTSHYTTLHYITLHYITYIPYPTIPYDTNIRPYIHACMHACIHPYIHTQTYITIYIYIYIYNILLKKELLFNSAMLSCEDPKGLYHSLGLDVNADETDIRRANPLWIDPWSNVANGEISGI